MRRCTFNTSDNLLIMVGVSDWQLTIFFMKDSDTFAENKNKNENLKKNAINI